MRGNQFHLMPLLMLLAYRGWFARCGKNVMNEESVCAPIRSLLLQSTAVALPTQHYRKHAHTHTRAHAHIDMQTHADTVDRHVRIGLLQPLACLGKLSSRDGGHQQS